MTKIGILYGGRSTEHDGSVATRDGVIAELDKDTYELVDSIFIDRDGSVSLNEASITLGTLVDRIKNNRDIFYFNLMPGNEGEDGAWSGIFDICDGRGSFEPVNTASLLMNKYQQSCLAVSLLSGMVYCPASALITRGMGKEAIGDVLGGFSEEIIIKPNSMGSSHFMDIFIKSEKDRIIKFLAKLHEYDQAAIVQEFIEGENYSCGVFGEKGGMRSLPVVYQKIGARFMSHEVKFGGEWERIIVDNPLADRIRQVSVRLAEIFNLIGMCRFDFIVKNDRIYFLEGNIVPSLAFGGSFESMLIADGLNRNDLLAGLIYSFDNRVKNIKLLPYKT